MSEYDLVCDGCGQPLVVADGVVSWTVDGAIESGFALTHSACVPAKASAREELRRLVWPNEFLRFATARFGHPTPDPEPLRAIVWALAPFVMRHDNPAEMDGMRAATFGAIPGVKPGTSAEAGATQKEETEGGK
ncbi:MAG: hypothetical protein HY071_02720 [Chloroflexi bacterium]|nr:hypothetical protein [Chloroflexota bacterium]